MFYAVQGKEIKKKINCIAFSVDKLEFMRLMF
jgi:hypothetical protein